MMRFWGWDFCGIPVNNCGPGTAPETGASDPGGTLEQNSRKIAYNDIVHLIRGILAGNRMKADDAKRLLDWSVRYSIDLDDWPAGAIAHRLDHLCRPGSITALDAEDLNLLLLDIAGDPQPVVAEPAAIPFTQPTPLITFPDKQFVLLGHFLSGRARCMENLRLRGGGSGESVSATTDFLVIGALRSQLWVNHSIRAEVEAALAATRWSGPSATPVAIVSEASFLRAVGDCRVTNSNQSSAQPGSAKRSLRSIPEPVSRT